MMGSSDDEKHSCSVPMVGRFAISNAIAWSWHMCALKQLLPLPPETQASFWLPCGPTTPSPAGDHL